MEPGICSTDWIELWRELVEARERGRRQKRTAKKQDVWKTKAREFDQLVKRRWAKPDSSRTFMAADLEAHPGATVLDIGAGTGAWTLFLAGRVQKVTALDPSPAMLDVLRQNVEAAGLDNVEVVRGAWPEAEVPPHDVSLCSHAMYGVADFAAFVRQMEAVTRRRCYMLLRAPTPDGVMAEAARHIWGHPHDSPNFQVAYNALLQMGIFANVLMEDTGLWDPWVNGSLEEALSDVKRRFGLGESKRYDAYLRDLLARRLTLVEGTYFWPPGVRSALVFWDVEN